MGHLLVLALFITLGLRETLGAPLLGASLANNHPLAVLASVVIANLALLSVLAMVVSRAGRRAGTGDIRAIIRAEQWAAATRVGIVALHAASVFGLGSLDAVRTLIGDPIAIDELLGVLPPILAMSATWWIEFPIHQRLREVMLLRRLDEGEALPSITTRSSYGWSMVRMHVLFVLIPVTALFAWSDAATGLERSLGGAPGATAADLAWAPAWLREAAQSGLVSPPLIFAGVLGVFALFPLALRLIWPTDPLPPGELRTALDDAQRAVGVRPGRVLVWHTGHAMANGAVVGIVPSVRYVLLSDLLLSTLRLDELQAVAAHEAAHLRHRHALWLVLALLASAGLAGSLLWWAAVWTVAPPESETATLVVALGSVALALLVVGAVSRRFEWQADATAANALSQLRDPHQASIDPEASTAMARALRRVAAVNGVPIAKRGWRHGSIAYRIDRLDHLVGRASAKLPINRQVRAIKIAILVALAATALLAVADAWLRL